MRIVDNMENLTTSCVHEMNKKLGLYWVSIGEPVPINPKP